MCVQEGGDGAQVGRCGDMVVVGSCHAAGRGRCCCWPGGAPGWCAPLGRLQGLGGHLGVVGVLCCCRHPSHLWEPPHLPINHALTFAPPACAPPRSTSSSPTYSFFWLFLGFSAPPPAPPGAPMRSVHRSPPIQVAIEPELAPALSELVDNTSGQVSTLRETCCPASPPPHSLKLHPGLVSLPLPSAPHRQPPQNAGGGHI